MQIQTIVLGIAGTIVTIIIHLYVSDLPVKDYEPDRPNNTYSDGTYNIESTFTAPRGYITPTGKSQSLLTLPDGRQWVIQEQTPGEYIDIRVVDNTFHSGTLLMKGHCSEKDILPLGFDISHCE